MVEPFEQKMRRGGEAALLEASQFLMGKGNVQETLKRISQKLNELKIPYAICGGMALVAHGYERTTEDVDILVTAEALTEIHKQLTGLGYRPVFSGSKNLRDTETGVKIEFLVTGGFPGDGKPKPVVFPVPDSSNIDIDGRKYLSLQKLIELKLASGMTNLLRAKDIGDVIALIQSLGLNADFAQELNPFVRDKYMELWNAIQQDESREE